MRFSGTISSDNCRPLSKEGPFFTFTKHSSQWQWADEVCTVICHYCIIPLFASLLNIYRAVNDVAKKLAKGLVNGEVDPKS